MTQLPQEQLPPATAAPSIEQVADPNAGVPDPLLILQGLGQMLTVDGQPSGGGAMPPAVDGDGEAQMEAGEVALEMTLNHQGAQFLQSAYKEMPLSEAMTAVKAFRTGDLSTYAKITQSAQERANDRAPAEREKELENVAQVMTPGGVPAEGKSPANFIDAASLFAQDLKG